jgi:hypothetical protein
VAVAGYEVYRDGVEVADIAGASFDDSGLIPLTTYTYSVRASDTSHNVSEPSAPLPVATSSDSIPVNDFIDMNVTDPDGTILSTAIINNGLVGPDRAVKMINANGLLIGTHRVSRLGPVTVGGVTYPADHPSRSIVVDHTRNFQQFEIDTYGDNTTQMTIAGWVTFGPPDAGAQGRLFDYWNIYGGRTGEFVVMQLDNGQGGAGYGLTVETNPKGITTHSTYITLAPGATYWCVLHADYTTGIAQLSVYDTALTLVGNAVTPQSTGEVIGYIRMGNGEIGTAAASSYMENLLLDYSNALYPIVPGL